MHNHQEVIAKIDKSADALTNIMHQVFDIWVQDVVFTWRWWLGLIFTILPWILWSFYKKKESSDRLLYVAFVIILISVILDSAGDQYGVWRYRYNLLPIVPTYFPWDFTLMPVTIITFIQIKPMINLLYKAISFSLIASYVAEPIFHWLDVYRPIHWKYTYSLPIQFIIYLLSHWIYQKKFHVEK